MTTDPEKIAYDAACADALLRAKTMARQALTKDFGHCALDHPVFFMRWNEALVPGHIYSWEGLKEFNVSSLCEWCFDDIFPEQEE